MSGQCFLICIDVLDVFYIYLYMRIPVDMESNLALMSVNEIIIFQIFPKKPTYHYRCVEFR